MLISPIDRNKESEPEKHVSKIKSPYWTLPANGGLGSPQGMGPARSSEGIILRVRDTRLNERRKTPSPMEPPDRERRLRDNRHDGSRVNTLTHHVLVIALERKSGVPDPWKAGDRVSVVAKSITTSPQSQDDVALSTDAKTNRTSLLTKDDEDYVVHLSGNSPTDL